MSDNHKWQQVAQSGKPDGRNNGNQNGSNRNFGNDGGYNQNGGRNGGRRGGRSRRGGSHPHPYNGGADGNSRGRRQQNVADVPLSLLQQVASKVDSLESKLNATNPQSSSTAPPEEKKKFSILYILQKTEGAKLPDAEKFISEVRKRYNVDTFYIKCYTDMTSPKFNSNASPNVIIFDLINHGVSVDKSFRQKPKFGITDPKFYTELGKKVKIISDFREAASDAYPDATVNCAVMDNQEMILGRGPAYFCGW